MDFAAETLDDDNAPGGNGERLLITILLGLDALVFFSRDNVFTKCGETSAGCSLQIGKFGSDCGAASILCTDMLRLTIPFDGIFVGESMVWPLLM